MAGRASRYRIVAPGILAAAMAAALMGLPPAGCTPQESEPIRKAEWLRRRQFPPEQAPPRPVRTAGEPPQLELGRMLIDAGTLARDSRHDETIAVRNVGRGPLIISRIIASCPCLEATVDRTTLQPGQTAEIALTVLTRHKRGRVTEALAIVSNDPASPTLLTVRFTVPPS